MGPSKLKFGFIGGGSRAKVLVKSCLTTQKADIIAVCDIDSVKLEELQKLIQTDLQHDVQTFTDYRDLLKVPEIDAVIVAIPDHLHYSAALDVLGAKKHLFLEKPAGITFDQTLEMAEFCGLSEVIGNCGQTLRKTSLKLSQSLLPMKLRSR